MSALNIPIDAEAQENPFAIYSVKLCCEGKYLIAAARGGHATLFKFTGSELEKADEGLGDLACLEIPILHRNVYNEQEDINSSGASSTSNEVPSRQSADKKASVRACVNTSSSNGTVRFVGIQEFTSRETRLPSNGWLSTRARLSAVVATE